MIVCLFVIFRSLFINSELLLCLQIKTHCESDQGDNAKQGEVEECLKRKFDSLTAVECRRHVALLITAVQIDIQADPLLHRACAIDLVTFCKDIPPGEGRSTPISYLHFWNI